MLLQSTTAPEDSLYTLSWSNPAWSHLLCTANVLDYFCDLSNPFYDRQCNNEVIRMQRLSAEQLLCMTGVEYYLHQAQEPILFVIRKQYRHSSTQVTPLAYFYIISGTVLQAPDLSSLLNARLLTTVNRLSKVLQTLAPSARYHPSDGSYSWDDPNTLMGIPTSTNDVRSPTTSAHNPDSSHTATNIFQIKHTDFLLAEWANRFPLPSANFTNQSGPSTAQHTPAISVASGSGAAPIGGALKEESHDVRANVKPPNLPGVGPNSMSIPPSHLSTSVQFERKPRVS